MKQSAYLSLHNRVLAHPAIKRLVVSGARFLPLCVYLCYPLMLLGLFLTHSPELWRSILVPAVGFLTVTVLRSAIDAPRPYEVLGIPAVTPKDTAGKSFPSRHAASASVIAVTALRTVRPLGIALILVSLLIAASRVLTGVHFIRDVLCGLLLGGVIGFVGMYLIP